MDLIMTLTVTHAIISVFLIIFVLLQFGKGAEAGIFSGGSGEVFSSSQSGNILTTITTVLVAAFLGLSVTLAALRSNTSAESDIFDEAEKAPNVQLQIPEQEGAQQAPGQPKAPTAKPAAPTEATTK
jgi:preprotein translocase subunit SecG